ncbi:hypothetical protein, partial [Nonomuraea angiospora]|uniref:hypothetical protein n=1 Tax=Nonomuraea angiospora TaxID=46172 RepID=UPI0029BC402C
MYAIPESGTRVGTLEVYYNSSSGKNCALTYGYGSMAGTTTFEAAAIRVAGGSGVIDSGLCVFADLVNSAAALVGHWQLDEESGTGAAESSGRSAAATLTGGASWTAGWLGCALAPDGPTGQPGGRVRARFRQGTAARSVSLDWERFMDLPSELDLPESRWNRPHEPDEPDNPDSYWNRFVK